MKKNVTAVFITILCALICITNGHAESLKVKKMKKSWEEKLTHYNDNLQKACGKEIEVKLDSESWSTVPESQQNYSFGEYCGNGCLFGTELVCGDELGKESVANQIDKIVCKHKQDDKSYVNVTFDKESKTLECTFSLYDMQFQKKVKEQVEGLL